MSRIPLPLAVLFLGFPAAGNALGAADHDHDHGADTVVPDHEHGTEAALAAHGPTDHLGVGVEAIGAVALAEVAELADRQVRVRVVTIAPGGRVAVHEHRDRPGFAYILSGTATEHRDGKTTPYGPGKVAFERDGDVHWWENQTEEQVRALVVDLVPQE